MASLASLYIKRLKEKLSLETDEALASKIGVGKSTVSSWRQRGQIPAEMRADLQKKFGVKYSDVQREYAVALGKASHLIEAAVAHSILRLGASIAPDEWQDWASWLVSNKHTLVNELLANVEFADADDAEEVFTRAYISAVSGNVLAVPHLTRLRHERDK
jgi:transcriptional regulator with XRE-family HTH domain